MSDLPYQPWYRSNWRAEPTLRLCSYSAHGLWRELLELAFDADPYGYVLINGVPPTPETIAAVATAKTTPDEVRALLAELEAAGVFSRNDSGVIFCRRMVREGRPARKGSSKAKARVEDDAPEQPASEPLGKLVDRIVEHYVREMGAVHGLKAHQVVVPVGAARGPLRKLVAVAGVDEVLRYVSAFVRLDDPFLRENGYSLHWLPSRMPRIAMAKPAPMLQLLGKV